MRCTFLLAVLFGVGCGGPLGLPVPSMPGETGLTSEPAHGIIEGIVVDPSGAPIAGAHLVSQPRGHEAESAGDGVFELPWLPPGDYRLIAAASGFDPVFTAEVTVDAGVATALEITLQPVVVDALVTVLVRGPDGAPLPGAVVGVSTGQQAEADTDGVAVLTLDAGEPVDLWVEDAEGALWPRRLEGVALQPGGGLQWDVRLAGRPPADAVFQGSARCGYCHAEQATAHGASAHARAHCEQPSDALLARFAEADWLELGEASVTLWLDEDTPTVTLTDRSGEVRNYPVVSYLGDPSRRSVPVVLLDDSSFPLPLAWRAGVEARPDYPDSEPTLAPFEPDRWFTDEGDFVDGGPFPERSAEASCLPCHSAGYDLVRREDGGADLSWASGTGRYDGVGCEACHGPGGGHTGLAEPSTITRPTHLDPARADEVCGQCHARTVGLDSDLPHPHAEAARFLPGDTLADFAGSNGNAWPSGAAAVSRMQLDEHRGSRHGQGGAGLRCLDCHGVHAEIDGASHLLRAGVQDNTLCEACHLGSAQDDPEEAVLAHSAHRLYQPAGAQEGARCTGCHMPPTASDGWWSAQSGAGERRSHRFAALSPADTLALFDAAGSEVLPVGAFPPHACSDCHAWNAWYWESYGWSFAGPHGDPTEAATHEGFLQSWEALYP